MIWLDMGQAASFIFCAVVVIWVAASICGDRGSAGRTLDASVIWYCSVCTYTYIYARDDRITVCPRCGSYNTKEEAGGRERKDAG